MADTQQKNIYKTIALSLLFIVVVIAGFVHKVLQPRVLGVKEMVNNGAIMFQTPREISDFALTDKNGKAFTLEQFRGQWTLVFFGFTHCPDICPTTLATFNELSGALDGTGFDDDTQYLLVSLDPARDTVDKLKTYVDYFNPAFQGVTGEFRQLLRFATQLNVAYQKIMLGDGDDPAHYTIDHGGHVALVNPRGHYHGFFKPPIEVGKLALTYKSVRMENR